METLVSSTDSTTLTTELEQPLFKAVGVIKGEVKLGEDGINTVVISGKSYRLKYSSEKVRAIQALKLQIKNTSNNEQRLIVHPRVIHFPNREQPYIFYFELVGFESSLIPDKGIFNILNDFEFKISGLWQFIPVCRVPCISVFRNFTEERKLFIKAAEPLVKMRFMKSSHLPLFWQSSPVAPFRFNPRMDKKEQGHPKFVQIKAKFSPERDSFLFMEQLAAPLEEAPKFLKASKQDTAEHRKKTAQSKTIKKELVSKPKLTRKTEAPRLKHSQT